MSDVREVASFTKELWQAYGRPRESRARLDAVKAARLASVLQQKQQTPWERGRVLRSLDDVVPMRKAEVLERFNDTLAVRDLSKEQLLSFVNGGGVPGQPVHGRYLCATTSGTTGQIGVFVDNLSGWARQRAIVFARLFQGLLTPEGFALLARRRYRMAFVVGVGGHWLTSILAARIPRAGRVVAQSEVISVDQPLSQTLAALNDYQPMLLHTYPTFLEVLADEKRKGTLRCEPELLSVGSEPVTPSLRHIVCEQFPRARFVETYAATECLAMASACQHGSLHVNEDACVLESVDDDLHPVPHGTWGSRVLVTNLLNHTQPLVRYELTDSICLLEGACPCGSALTRVAVQGRTDDTFYLVDHHGRVQSHPPIPFETIFLGVDGLVQYQLVHVEQNALLLRYVKRDDAEAAPIATELQSRLLRHLHAHALEDSVRVSTQCVAAIERSTKSHKVRQIHSLVPRPSGPVHSAASVRAPR